MVKVEYVKILNRELFLNGQLILFCIILVSETFYSLINYKI